MTMILQDLTGDEIDEMIREADLDGDGKVKSEKNLRRKLETIAGLLRRVCHHDEPQDVDQTVVGPCQKVCLCGSLI